jgi:hypothetical protein
MPIFKKNLKGLVDNCNALYDMDHIECIVYTCMVYLHQRDRTKDSSAK